MNGNINEVKLPVLTESGMVNAADVAAYLKLKAGSQVEIASGGLPGTSRVVLVVPGEADPYFEVEDDVDNGGSWHRMPVAGLGGVATLRETLESAMKLQEGRFVDVTRLGCAEQDRPHEGELPEPKVVILPDGYNGHTMKFFVDPVQVDGNVVKLRCAEPGKEDMTAWRDRTAVLAAVAVQGGCVPEVACREDVFAIRNALREVLLTSKAPNKAAETAQEKAYAVYLASFTAEEKAYVVSAARLWQTEKRETGFFQNVELDSFEAVVRNLGRGLVHDFITAAQAKAVSRSVIAPDMPDGVDWTVSVEICVTADSAVQAAKFAVDDLRDLTLEEINVDVENLKSGRIEAVSVKSATS